MVGLVSVAALSSACLLLILVEGKKRTDPGENCPPNLCCKTNINGLYFSVCPTGYEGIVSIANHPIPSVIQSPIQLPNLYLHGQTNLGRNLPRSNDFTLKLFYAASQHLSYRASPFEGSPPIHPKFAQVWIHCLVTDWASLAQQRCNLCIRMRKFHIGKCVCDTPDLPSPTQVCVIP